MPKSVIEKAYINILEQMYWYIHWNSEAIRRNTGPAVENPVEAGLF